MLFVAHAYGTRTTIASTVSTTALQLDHPLCKYLSFGNLALSMFQRPKEGFRTLHRHESKSLPSSRVSLLLKHLIGNG